MGEREREMVLTIVADSAYRERENGNILDQGSMGWNLSMSTFMLGQQHFKVKLICDTLCNGD